MNNEFRIPRISFTSSFRTPLHSVSLKTDIEHVTLDIDAAIHCGLIINELISNSLKHAFTAEGEIHISFTQTALDGANEYILIVSGNCKSISDSIDLKQSKSLGLQ